MASESYHRVASTNWLAVFVSTAFCACAGLVTFRHMDEVAQEAAPLTESEASLPSTNPATENADGSPQHAPADEQWNEVRLGSISLKLPGEPQPDSTTGWFDHYPKVERLDAFRVPVEHRKSHVQVSVVRNTQGKISINAAAKGAKQGIDTDFGGVTTIFPFEFREFQTRHLTARPVNLDELTRLHCYLVIHNNEMLILSVTGHDKHPQRLAHQILRTVVAN